MLSALFETDEYMSYGSRSETDLSYVMGHRGISNSSENNKNEQLSNGIDLP